MPLLALAWLGQKLISYSEQRLASWLDFHGSVQGCGVHQLEWQNLAHFMISGDLGTSLLSLCCSLGLGLPLSLFHLL